jgi:L-2-hydroxyglutarate oxidase LhgO
MHEYVIIGGGIVGLATAMTVGKKYPKARILVLDKEQNSRNTRLAQLIPEVTRDHLVPTRSGVRAEALRPDGKLVDDFLIAKGKNSVHVCNVPSPAATASLEIGRFIANHLPEVTPARRRDSHFQSW